MGNQQSPGSGTQSVSTPESRQQSVASDQKRSIRRQDTQDVIQQILAKGSIASKFSVDSAILGKGHYATVHLGRNKQTSEQVAVKRIQISRSRVEALKQEIFVLMEVGAHPNIVQLKDVFLTDTEVQLVMELLRGGELFDRMVESGPYSEMEASSHVRKIGEALAYLHSKGIVHRDLKPENLILVDKSANAELKIADFGLSKIVDDVLSSTMKTVCGTWAYAAPEVKTSLVPGSGASYTQKVDLWSLGVITFVILAAYHPFDPDGSCSDGMLWQRICSGVFNFDDPAWDNISEAAKDLIRHLIVVDPERRYGTDDLLRHPWVRGSYQISTAPITPLIDTNLMKFQERAKYASPRLGGDPMEIVE
jgi:calcium/calmodulin-dependent protein kinase-4